MLSLYLLLALMTLKLWELSGLIGGVAIVVFAQVIFMILVSYFVVFRILGKNYDSALLCAPVYADTDSEPHLPLSLT